MALVPRVLKMIIAKEGGKLGTAPLRNACLYPCSLSRAVVSSMDPVSMAMRRCPSSNRCSTHRRAALTLSTVTASTAIPGREAIETDYGRAASHRIGDVRGAFPTRRDHKQDPIHAPPTQDLQHLLLPLHLVVCVESQKKVSLLQGPDTRRRVPPLELW